MKPSKEGPVVQFWQSYKWWGWCVCVVGGAQLEDWTDVQTRKDLEGHAKYLVGWHLLFCARDRVKVRIIICPECSWSCQSLISSCYYFTHNKIDSELWVSIRIPKTLILLSGLGRNVAQEFLISERALQSSDSYFIIKLFGRIYIALFWMEVAF